MRPQRALTLACLAVLFHASLGAAGGVSDPPTDVLWAPGPHAVSRIEYDFPAIHTGIPLRGSVTFPSTGPGPFPLVVFQHGVSAVEDSFRGYDYLSNDLASRGYVVASVDADDLEDGERALLVFDTLERLAAYNATAAPLPLGASLVGRLDLTRIGLMGHSRGGQAVTRVIEENLARAPADRFAIRAVFSIAPTNQDADTLVDPWKIVSADPSRVARSGIMLGHEYARMAAYLATSPATYGPGALDRDPVDVALMPLFPPFRVLTYHVMTSYRSPGAAYGTLLPYCDGDIYDLTGAMIFDDSRYFSAGNAGAKYQILALGANHNYYNTLWTRDDSTAEWGLTRDDAYCGAATTSHPVGSGRMSADDQRRHARVYITAFFRHHLGGEDAVGTRLRGEAPPPREACPIGTSHCRDRIHVSYHPDAPDRLVIEDAADASALLSNDLDGPSTWAGFTTVGVCAPEDCPAQPTYGNATQLVLGWGPTSGSAPPPQYRLAFAPRDVRSFATIGVRVGVVPDDPRNPPGASQDLTVRLVDASGNVSSVRLSDHSSALFYPPGGYARKLVLNDARVPLSAFNGVDLGAIAGVDFVFDQTQSGLLQVADAMFRR